MLMLVLISAGIQFAAATAAAVAAADVAVDA